MRKMPVYAQSMRLCAMTPVGRGVARGLWSFWKRSLSQTIRVQKEEETPLLSRLRKQIIANGPLSVHDYMTHVLTDPQSGYYMHQDVFGERGDFTTSPEISQMFGEMVGVWLLNEWHKAGGPTPVHLVEVGPGRGTLTEDVVRVFAKYSQLAQSLTIHLVEVSPYLAKIQEQRLCGTSAAEEVEDDNFFKESRTRTGACVRWYRDVFSVPRHAYSFFLAHEFLDALPIHKFQRTDRGFREVLVDLDEATTSALHLRFVLAPNKTPSTLLIHPDEERGHVEVCPRAGIFAQHLAERLESDGGAALIVDYGHFGEKEDTFRAFRRHQLHDPLSQPGTADLTADVDFAYLRRCVQDKVLTYGPVSQGSFLTSMGMGLRLRKLLEVVGSRQEGEQLLSAYDMLVSPGKMGERFKFLAMLPKAMALTLDQNPPAGFEAELGQQNR